jgi:hypothetical protein
MFPLNIDSFSPVSTGQPYCSPVEKAIGRNPPMFYSIIRDMQTQAEHEFILFLSGQGTIWRGPARWEGKTSPSSPNP